MKPIESRTKEINYGSLYSSMDEGFPTICQMLSFNVLEESSVMRFAGSQLCELKEAEKVGAQEPRAQFSGEGHVVVDLISVTALPSKQISSLKEYLSYYSDNREYPTKYLIIRRYWVSWIFAPGQQFGGEHGIMGCVH